MKVIYNLNDQQVSQLHNFYQNEWWSKDRTIEETRLCATNSQITIGLVDEHDKLIAFTRVLTDGIFKALIFDVIVSPEYRGHGLGERLVKAVKGHQKLSKVKHFELYCTPEMQPFYERYGFSTDVGAMQLMRCSES